MIGIVNYGSGNVAAIANIFKQLKVPHVIAGTPAELDDCDKYILPGVGRFDRTIRHLRDSGVFDCLSENALVRRKPLLGVCVGMQLLASASEEGGEGGLGWIPGSVTLIPAASGKIKLPHMGWNEVSVVNDPLHLFKNVDARVGFYFLHSYRFEPVSRSHVAAETSYGEVFACAVSNGANIVGVQFHPEKSHKNGMMLLGNFSRL